jgi:hypothetical protein
LNKKVRIRKTRIRYRKQGEIKIPYPHLVDIFILEEKVLLVWISTELEK